MRRILHRCARQCLATLFMAACAIAAAQDSPPALRELASRFGLTPGQAREIYRQIDTNEDLIAQLSQENGVHRQTLRAAALELGARNPGLSPEAFAQLIRARAADAAAQRKTLAALRETLASLDPSGERTEALAILKQAQAAFDAGRLEEAEAHFGRLSFLRRTELNGAYQAWLAATDLQAQSAALRGDVEAADRILSENAAEIARRLHAGERDLWRKELKRAYVWYTNGDQLGKNDDLRRAIRIYREVALPLAPRERVPRDWAATQNNLGTALQALGERESGTARLEQAVQAYRAALQEFTHAGAPLDWATTQNNLGNALWTLGEREPGTERLEEAVEAYRTAQEEFTQDRRADRFNALSRAIAEVEQLIKARRSAN
ncbi:MAG: tetratricopeptide repeat protein [Zoogloeaceae bacterium]|nr:tetratricopeptide repeat protein [Zoogloeaceae bacterium]